MDHEADRRLAAVAASQYALVTAAQARELGFTEKAVRERVAAGRWECELRGVYRIAGVARSWRQALFAACLAAGPRAVASHRAAAALWRLDGAEERVEVTVDRPQSNRMPGVIVHRSADLSPDVVTVCDSVPLTTPARTLVDLGAVAKPWVIERALDHAVGRRLVTIEGVRFALDAVARRGRRGAGVLRELLDERAGTGRHDSVLEGAMLRLCRTYGLPQPQCQCPVYDGRRFIGRVDFAYPRLRIVIEVDGYESHGGFDAFVEDRARQNELVAAGWTILRFTWDDVIRRPERVAAVIRRVLGAETAVQGR